MAAAYCCLRTGNNKLSFSTVKGVSLPTLSYLASSVMKSYPFEINSGSEKELIP